MRTSLAFSRVAVSLLAAAVGLMTQISHALEVPAFTSPVVDLAQVFVPEEREQLAASLQAFQQEHGPQLAVLTIPSLQGESIEGYSIKVADAWKLGNPQRDDGLLLLVALEDRLVRIEVGQGLEGTLPDALAGRIIRDVMTPVFRSGRMDAGIVAGLNAIAGRLGGTLKSVPQALVTRVPPRKKSGLGGAFLFFIFFFLILPRIFGRGARGGFLTGMILGNVLGGRQHHHRGGWGGGGFGGGGFGGGFGGGGGGGFSGGGASGKW